MTSPSTVCRVPTAWTVALRCEEDPANMKDLFMLCYQMMSVSGDQGGGSVGHRRTCLLMATAACLQRAKTASEQPDTKALLEEALQFVCEYKSLDSKLLDGGATDDKRRASQVLMLLYEFEALTKLSDARAEAVLERALVMPTPEPKLFESIAALAMDSPARQSRLSMRALKVAIHTHLQCPQPDFSQCSKDIHQLIEQSLTCNEDEAFAYFKETADVLDKKAQGGYPQMEAVWLMTKSWNIGVRHFCCGSYTEAERWCAMSMRLLPHIGSLRDSYEDQDRDHRHGAVFDDRDHRHGAVFDDRDHRHGAVFDDGDHRHGAVFDDRTGITDMVQCLTTGQGSQTWCSV
ncbi:hypothetical protein ACOMHN_019248 [Nucella lapillus]